MSKDITVQVVLAEYGNVVKVTSTHPDIRVIIVDSDIDDSEESLIRLPGHNVDEQYILSFDGIADTIGVVGYEYINEED